MVHKSEWDIREALDWQSKGSRGENERATPSNRLSTLAPRTPYAIVHMVK